MSKNLPVKTIQYDLFSSFLSNEPESVSNTAELWESIPKYIFTAKQVEKLRTKDGLAQEFSWTYFYNNEEFKVSIQPALIKLNEDDEKSVACFPGVTEELVEEALKKIFTYNKLGSHDPDKHESLVKFSLYMISKELKNRGRTRSLNQIKQALQVMNKCAITLYKKDLNKKKFSTIWQGHILETLFIQNREDYTEDSSSLHCAKLSTFITHSINTLDYRQFNYDRLMECDEQLSRWLYKKLIHRYKHAAINNDYHFTFSSVVQESALLQQTSDRHNRQKLHEALEELIKKKVIREYKVEFKKDGSKVIDATYLVFPTAEFIQEQKAANKRYLNSQEQIEHSVKEMINE